MRTNRERLKQNGQKLGVCDSFSDVPDNVGKLLRACFKMGYKGNLKDRSESVLRSTNALMDTEFKEQFCTCHDKGGTLEDCYDQVIGVVASSDTHSNLQINPFNNPFFFSIT